MSRLRRRVSQGTARHAASPHCAVVELRQCTSRPGRRDTLIELFGREFVESQQACGMRLFGQFRDLDDPDRFVWRRGFRDMHERARALAGLHVGPIWSVHREAANATMVDSDDVLLPRPSRAGTGFAHAGACRVAGGSEPTPCELVNAMIWQLPLRIDAGLAALIEGRIAPLLPLPAQRCWRVSPANTRPTHSRRCQCVKARTCSSRSPASTTRRIGNAVSAHGSSRAPSRRYRGSRRPRVPRRPSRGGIANTHHS